MTTETSTALVPIKVAPPKSILPSRQELSIIGTIARTVIGARGHAVPASIDSPAKAAAVMLAGHELGIKPMTALRHIFVVNGRTEPDAQIMAGIVNAAEPDARFDIVELTFEKCTMRLSRPAKGANAVWEYTYEYADAERAGLTAKPGPWKMYPKDMMRWAATKRLCRTYAPDLINSVGTVEITTVQDLLETVDEDNDQVDLDELPEGTLYNVGDQVVDVETGEIIEGQTTPSSEGSTPADEHGAEAGRGDVFADETPGEAEGSAPAVAPSNEHGSAQQDTESPTASGEDRPAASPPTDVMPGSLVEYRARVMAMLEAAGHERDVVEAASQQAFGNRSYGNLGSKEIQQLARDHGLEVPLPGQKALAPATT